MRILGQSISVEVRESVCSRLFPLTLTFLLERELTLLVVVFVLSTSPVLTTLYHQPYQHVPLYFRLFRLFRDVPFPCSSACRALIPSFRMGVLVRLRRLWVKCKESVFVCGVKNGGKKRVPLYLNRLMTQRCWVVKRGAGQMRGPIRMQGCPSLTFAHALSSNNSSSACDSHSVYSRLMSAAGKASQAAQYALKSIARAARDAAKKPSIKDGLTSKPTAFETKGINYDYPITKDGMRSTRTNATGQPSTTSDVPGESPSFAAESPRVTKPSSIARYLYDPNPTAINYLTFASTRMIAEDPSHPYHIRTIRRLEAFDPSRLHWRVHVPIDVSKKSAIRNWAKKRVVRVFAKELKDFSLERGGSVMDGKQGEGLRGALLVIMSKDPKVALTFTDEEIREDIASTLRAVREKQRTGRRTGPASAPLKKRRGIDQG